MHEFLFGSELSDNDCRDLFINEKSILYGIQSQINFIIAFDLPINSHDKYYFMDDIQNILYKNYKNIPQLTECKFRSKDKIVAIFWHD
jgi:hypothetical protein